MSDFIDKAFLRGLKEDVEYEGAGAKRSAVAMQAAVARRDAVLRSKAVFGPNGPDVPGKPLRPVQSATEGSQRTSKAKGTDNAVEGDDWTGMDEVMAQYRAMLAIEEMVKPREGSLFNPEVQKTTPTKSIVSGL